MTANPERQEDPGAMLHPELRAGVDADSVVRDGRRLDAYCVSG